MRKLKPIEFYFEFASPYGYFASVTVDSIAEKHGRTVLWRPIMLGVALNATGSKPNVLVPMKGEYFKRDIARCAKVIDLPFSLPKKMPMNSLSASRAFYWLNEQDPRKAKDLAAAIYYEHWGLGNDMSDLDDVARVAEAIHGMELDTVAFEIGYLRAVVRNASTSASAVAGGEVQDIRHHRQRPRRARHGHQAHTARLRTKCVHQVLATGLPCR